MACDGGMLLSKAIPVSSEDPLLAKVEHARWADGEREAGQEFTSQVLRWREHPPGRYHSLIIIVLSQHLNPPGLTLKLTVSWTCYNTS